MITDNDKRKLKKLLVNKTGCDIQHNGWPCNSCFHAMDLVTDKDIHDLWESTLVVRGDYINGEYFYIEPATIRDNIKHLIEIL